MIGRGSGSDVQIPNEDVSRQHAVFWQEAGSAWVGDLDSSNGTYLNGERVHGPTPIVDGDLLTLGRTEFLVGRVLMSPVLVNVLKVLLVVVLYGFLWIVARAVRSHLAAAANPTRPTAERSGEIAITAPEEPAGILAVSTPR